MCAQCPHGECRDVHSWAAAVALLVMEGQEIRRGGGKKRKKNGILSTSRALEASVTYAISFAARSTLWTRQTSVSLFSLLTRRSNQANQTWVTLWDEDKDVTLCKENTKKIEP